MKPLTSAGRDEHVEVEPGFIAASAGRHVAQPRARVHRGFMSASAG
jgi:hypothetical protein